VNGNVFHRRLPGLYADSLVLMQLQRALEARAGIGAAAAVMATPANRELLAEQGLLPPDLGAPRPDDLLVVVRSADEVAAGAALGEVEALLAARRAAAPEGEHRPRSLRGGLAALPSAGWVLVSVPGRWAAGVAREALAAGRHVFLYSDNVPVADEVALKAEAARRGLLVLGPDCGTAIVGGAGLGFANRVRRGGIGLVAASGTGLQAVACGIDARGEGISQALGTGGRDVSAAVGGATARAALDLLARDPETRVIVLISKPPDPDVAARLLAAARATDKPVVVWFLGAAPPARRVRNLWFAVGSDEAAELAVELARSVGPAEAQGERGAAEEARGEAVASQRAARQEKGGEVGSVLGGPADVGLAAQVGAAAAGGGDRTPEGAAGRAEGDSAAGPADGEPGAWRLRGLFSGGTLAAEALAGLSPFLAPLASNLAAPGVVPLEARKGGSPPAGPAPPHGVAGAAGRSGAGFRGHLVLDLGADDYTSGRPHPMLDPSLVADQLRLAGAEPDVRLLLFDVVLGDGAHPDPAGLVAPAVAEALGRALAAGRPLDAIAILVGTESDPQDLAAQAERLAAAGARVAASVAEALRYALAVLETPVEPVAAPVPLAALAPPLAAVNVGLPSFAAALAAQGAPAVHVDWRPPAGGDERLARILERAKS
jgi:FdrA protein